LALTDGDLQQRETGRSEISARGNGLRRAGQEGAVAARLAVAAIWSCGVQGGRGRRGREKRRTASERAQRANPHS
jgi:hypothetical protein